MPVKALEKCVRDLMQTVLDLQNKVISLESVILEQNQLIKQFAKPIHISNLVATTDNSESKSEVDSKKRPGRTNRQRAASSALTPVLEVQAGQSDRSQSSSPLPTCTTPQLTASMFDARLSGEASTTLQANATRTNDSSVRDENPQWENVTHRRTARSRRTSHDSIARGTAAPGSTSLEASERKAYLHVYYLKSGTTVEQMVNHLMTICPNDVCRVEQLK
ncbi:unnamed protein product, partial [Leptosia nina]